MGKELSHQPTQPKKRPSYKQYQNPANLLPPPFGLAESPNRSGPTSHSTTVAVVVVVAALAMVALVVVVAVKAIVNVSS